MTSQGARASPCRSGFRWLRVAAAALLVALLAIPGAADAGSPTTPPASREYLIKAAFLYDLIQSVHWPQRAGGSLRLCVLGQGKFGAAWGSIDGRMVGERSLTVRHTLQIPALSACDVLFVGDSETGRLPEVIAAAAAFPVLTVSELPDFAEAGGMVRLRNSDNKLRFDVNPAALRRAGLALTADALQLADIVGDDRAVLSRQDQQGIYTSRARY